MGWFSIDAVDSAVKRAKKALFEPFDFWKWIKLGIISILIGGGGGGGSNFYSGDFDRPSKGGDIPFPSIDEISGQISQFWHQYMTLILIAVIFFVFIILLFGYISSVMEFVLVESLVTNTVAFWQYSIKYLRPGLNLFLIRLVLGLFFLSVFILAMYPVVMPIIEPFGNISSGMIFGVIFRLVVVLLAIAIVNGIIESFINLSIPLAMYNDMGIITAFKKIFGNFRIDWKQIVVYWVVRLVLGLVAAIAVGIAALILLLILIIILLIPGAILYVVLTGLGAGTGNVVFWIIMLLYALVAMVVLLLFVLMVSAPVPVFMKHHMLAFLQMWFKDARIPFADNGTSSAGK